MGEVDPRWPAPFPLEPLCEVLEDLTGLQVRVSHKPRKALGMRGGEKAWILASSATSRELGVDEQRTQANPNDPSGNTLQFNVCGQRLYVVTFRAESLDSGPSPVSILERIRWGLRTTTYASRIEALGIAVAGFEAIQNLPGFSSDDRELVTAALDVSFNWAVNFIPELDDGTTIGQVNGSDQTPGTPPTITGTVDTP